MTKKEEDIEIGRRIKSIRAELDLNQKEFANRINSTVSALSNWENGRNKPNDIMLNKISKLGNTSIDYILYGDFQDRIKHILLSKQNVNGELTPFVINYFKNNNRLYPSEKEIFDEYNNILAIIKKTAEKKSAENLLGISIRIAKNELSNYLKEFSADSELKLKFVEESFNRLKNAESFYEAYFDNSIDELYDDYINDVTES